MINIEEEKIPILVELKGGDITANIVDAQPLSVTIGQAAALDVGQAITYIKSGKAEIEAVVSEKTTAFNLNASQKTDAFNTNAANKTNDFNNNAEAILNGKQDKLTAGSNIQINGNVISATDTTYTAGTGIAINDGVISNTQTSAEWGNITGTLSSQIDLQSALNAKQAVIDASNKLSASYVSGLATVATTGAYSDLTGTPTIPTVNNATLTITQGGVSKGTFTANASSDVTIALDAGGGSSLPSQTGNSGKFLTTDGTDPSWADVNYNNLSNKPDLSVFALDNAVVHLAGTETITGTKTFSATTYGTASDAANSVVTTVNKSKSGDGYFEFGNGLIVQWGVVSSTTNTSGTVNFPKAFTSTNYVAVANCNNHASAVGTSAYTKTGFQWDKDSANRAIRWIAIGY